MEVKVVMKGACVSMMNAKLEEILCGQTVRPFGAWACVRTRPCVRARVCAGLWRRRRVGQGRSHTG